MVQQLSLVSDNYTIALSACSDNVCGSDTSSLFSESQSGWADVTKFLTGASAVGSIAIPIILKHAGVIGSHAIASILFDKQTKQM
ncbi:unnamed protein product [Coffea canephora]|uniref:DH200=94 genomic scaffold, scaffold_7180 n=1 Tax=Coffea canephora TaxID=49390 RepID=A0A068VM28_COFCA|nr:unnamed protein product [Coffea canephora]